MKSRLKATEGHWTQMSSCWRSIVIMALSCIISEKARCWLKIADFSHPMHLQAAFHASVGEVSVKVLIQGLIRKNKNGVAN